MLKYAESFPGLHQVSPNIFDIYIMRLPFETPFHPGILGLLPLCGVEFGGIGPRYL